jgi:pyruvate/2-oxoglutarate dehydrogenase complex dihydrolipoamide dehydrogenase (E3) component
VPRSALVVLPRMVARAGFAAELGLEPVEHPMGTRLPVDATGRTPVPGVWAAGNVTDPMANVVVSVAAGMTTAAAITADLVGEDASIAVARRKQPFSAAAEAANAVRIAGERRHGLASSSAVDR